jgi:hypothetical protein
MLVAATLALAMVAAACGDGDEGAELEAEDQGGVEEPQAMEIPVALEELNDSGISGVATLTVEEGVVVLVEVSLEGTEGPNPVHIHSGTCADLGGVSIPLNDVEDGISSTEIEANVDQLFEGEFAINVHLSPEEADVYVACGDLGQAAESRGGAGGGLYGP